MSGVLESLLSRALAGESIVSVERKRITKSLELIDVGISTAPVRDATGTVTASVVVYVDMREQKRIEAEREHQRVALFNAEKMAALGRLAAGVGHELKNPLTVIGARVELLERQTNNPDAVARSLKSVRDASDRMKHIMAGLSNYAKPTKSELMVLDVAHLVQATADLLAFEARKADVRIDVDVAAALPSIRVERSQFTQILVNLATNAIEAMAEGGGGTLTLRADGESNGVRIDVIDTGPGIPTDRLASIWEPFYTTKAEGTGLGLSIIRGLVAEQPGAKINVASTRGVGTTFTITLPGADTASVTATGGLGT